MTLLSKKVLHLKSIGIFAPENIVNAVDAFWGRREGKQSLSPRLFIALPALCTSNAKFAKNSL